MSSALTWISGDSVIVTGMVGAIMVRGRAFYTGPPVVRGMYAEKMPNWHMVKTRRARIYLCSNIEKVA